MNILLIHGLFGSLSNPELLDAFPSKASVIAPDLRGYGVNKEDDTSLLSLSDQVDHLVDTIKSQIDGPVNVVGHSVGGAVGLLLASDHPALVSSYLSVEGNMTLKDAFWSAKIAKTPLNEVEEIINGYKADVGAWLAGADVADTPEHSRIATQWLLNQPASTIKAQAAAVVAETAKPDYLKRFDRLVKNNTPIHLMAGEKSMSGWDLPDNIASLSSGVSNIENCGHLMMLEDPKQFAAAVCKAIA